MAVPPGKQFHVFLTHKKEHSETEQWAVGVKDQLKGAGFEAFFDVVSLLRVKVGFES